MSIDLPMDGTSHFTMCCKYPHFRSFLRCSVSNATSSYSVCDKSVRYVAEENILPVPSSTTPSEAMLKLAGRHFKRWDDDNGVFVSNIRDEYPDD